MLRVDEPHAGFEEWLGRERIQEDVLSLSSARALAATLDRDPDALMAGDPLPAGWHWIYFPPLTRRSELGGDGIETRGAFLPPVPLPRRMWAGGRLRFPGVVRLGDSVRRVSTIQSIRPKEGRTGPLVFVTVRHRISSSAGVAIDEEQDLVYRAESGSGAPSPVVAPEGGPAGAPARDRAADSGRSEEGSSPKAASSDWSEPFTADEVTLFRFSALTFNGHRIHYDHPYVTGVEGYPGLVVHGPLLALLLLDAAVRHMERTPALFSYRARAPLYCGERFLLQGRGPSLAAVHPTRGVAMEAEARLESTQPPSRRYRT